MTSIRFAIAQMNPTVGDYPGNAAKIRDWIQKASRENADIVVFPEIALSGYPVWDLANKREFVEEGLKRLETIVRASRGCQTSVVLGFIDRGAEPDARSRNALAWIENGKIRFRYYKQLLPTYDVFLEDIFFEPGKENVVLPWKSRKVGVSICEDIWDERYETKPLKRLKQRHADLVINISCSPYYHGVAEIRRDLIFGHVRRYGFPLLYVNQVGAQDDLIFDGRSFFMDDKGRTLFQAPAFEEGLFIFDWDPKETRPALSLPESSDTPEQIYKALKLGIQDYCRKNGFKKVLIGLSGGIDSALVATLAVDALGAKAVTGITMPGTYSSRGSWEDSKEIAKRLKMELRVYSIKKKYEYLLKQYRKQRKDELRPRPLGLPEENLQARLRGMELMYISNDEGKLLLTTGNKSELAMGYCTLYGDMAGGLAVIGDVYKTDIYRLAWWRNQKEEVIPKNILLKAPSAELRPNQKDEDSLPPYELLDEILYLYIERNRDLDQIARLMKPKKVSPSLIREVIRKVDHNEYKRRQTPPILRISQKAWFGRRMPITNRFEIE